MHTPTINLDDDDFRILHHLLTRWRNYHARYRVCCKRVNWHNRHASTIEKKRRREKWEIVASVLQIENEMIRMVAQITHDPSIWTPKKGQPRSRLLKLRRRYARNRRESHNPTLRGAETATKARARMREERKQIVSEIRHIIRSWMSQINTQILGEGSKLPRALPLHPAELIPRKLKRAYIKLRKEMVA